MPIQFACDCGKNFNVGEEFAGKRTKCPACGAGLTVPAPSPAAESEALSDEDKAFRALAEAPDPEPTAAAPSPRRERAQADEPPRQETPRTAPPKPRGPKLKSPYEDEYDQPRPRGGGIHLSPAVAGGLLSIVIAVVWFVLGLSAGRIFIYPPIMFVFGVVAVVRGMLGYSED